MHCNSHWLCVRKETSNQFSISVFRRNEEWICCSNERRRQAVGHMIVFFPLSMLLYALWNNNNSYVFLYLWQKKLHLFCLYLSYPLGKWTKFVLKKKWWWRLLYASVRIRSLRHIDTSKAREREKRFKCLLRRWLLLIDWNGQLLSLIIIIV